MSMDLDFFKNNWEWISANWWGSVGLVLFGLTVGMTIAGLYQGLVHRRGEHGLHAGAKKLAEVFSYPQFGRHGKNILSNSVGDVAVEERLSFRAEIPEGSRISVVLRGPIPEHLGDTDGSWYLPLGQSINWTFDTYQFDGGGKQTFSAEGGKADMQIYFSRLGAVKISVFEGESRIPSWSKEIHVVRRP